MGRELREGGGRGQFLVAKERPGSRVTTCVGSYRDSQGLSHHVGIAENVGRATANPDSDPRGERWCVLLLDQRKSAVPGSRPQSPPVLRTSAISVPRWASGTTSYRDCLTLATFDLRYTFLYSRAASLSVRYRKAYSRSVVQISPSFDFRLGKKTSLSWPFLTMAGCQSTSSHLSFSTFSSTGADQSPTRVTFTADSSRSSD